MEHYFPKIKMFGVVCALLINLDFMHLDMKNNGKVVELLKKITLLKLDYGPSGGRSNQAGTLFIYNEVKLKLEPKR